MGGNQCKKALKQSNSASTIGARHGYKKTSSHRGENYRSNDDGTINWVRSFSESGGTPKKLSDLIRDERRQYPNALHVILVDASGSTLKGNSLTKAKGQIQRMMEDAYLARWQIALLAFGGSELQILRAPSKVWRSEIKNDLLRLKAGGGSPILTGIEKALEMFKKHQQRYPANQLIMSILTDGRFIPPKIAIPDYIDINIIDMEVTGVRLGCCKALAENWNARYAVIT